MKYIIFLIFLFITSAVFSQSKVGNDGALHSTGTYAPFISSEGRGSARAVANQLARDAIPSYLREEGMMIITLSDTLTWVLSGGITNSDWKRATKSSTPGSIVINIDTTVSANHTIQITIPHGQGEELNETPSVQVDNVAASDFSVTSDDTNIYLTYPVSITGTFTYNITIRK